MTYIVTIELNSQQSLDKFLEKVIIDKGKVWNKKTVSIKEVKDGNIITAEYKRTV